MKSNEKVILTLTREQASIVEDACELYARLKIGQFNRITEMMLRVSASEDYCFRREIANNILKSAACVIFGMNAYGTPDCEKDTEHHRAWDVYQVLRYTRSWHDHPEGGFTVNFDKPMTFIGESLPECVIQGKRQKSFKDVSVEELQEMAFGDRLKYYRKKNGMTQAELEGKSGVKRNTIANYEFHRRSNPSIDHLVRLANALEVSVDELIVQRNKIAEVANE